MSQFLTINLLRYIKFILLVFSPAFPKGTYSLLPELLCTGENEIIRPSRDYWPLTELTQIPGDPKHHCGPPGRIGAYRG